MSLTQSGKVALNAPVRVFIGGEWVKPSSEAQFDVINASTEDVLFGVAEAQAEDMDRAVTAARRAFDRGPWRRLTRAERADYLIKIAEGLEERSAEIGQIWSGRMGLSPYLEAKTITLDEEPSHTSS